MNTLVTDRFVRQAELVPQKRLQELEITIIGVGAIGRPLALQLAAVGARHMQLIDPDTVKHHNVTTQGYSINEIGHSKVDALAATIHSFDPSIKVAVVKDVFRKHVSAAEVVFCCVDSISTRNVIWKSLASKLRFFTDGRMLGETLRILSVGDEVSRKHYPTTLFDRADAQVGRCTARSTLYAASIAAGLMVHQFSRWLRELPVDADIIMNLLASEMSVQGT